MAKSELIDRERDTDYDDTGLTTSTTTAMATTRQAQEVQAAMLVAKNYPRDEDRAVARILKSCSRKSLAEMSQYEYPRGGTTVSGPSIRLAEAMAQAWGNDDFGIIELERNHGESIALAYCWDLETNTRQTRVFTVRHVRDTKHGSKQLTDERDIYEVVANYGARRMRSCILGIIPRDVVDMAIEQCDKTLLGESKEPLEDRVRKMIVVFENEFGVTKGMIEAKIGHKTSAMTPSELAKLTKVYTSLRDGASAREDHFDIKAGEPTGKPKGLDELTDKLKGNGKESAKETPKEEKKSRSKAPAEEPKEAAKSPEAEAKPQVNQEPSEEKPAEPEQDGTGMTDAMFAIADRIDNNCNDLKSVGAIEEEIENDKSFTDAQKQEMFRWCENKAKGIRAKRGAGSTRE